MNTVKELRLHKGLSQQELADLCDVHQTAVSQWEKGRTEPDRSTLILLSEIFGVSVDYLIGRQTGEKHLIPLLGYVKAGFDADAVEEVLDYVEISAETAANGEHFALRIKGDSMEPRFCESDTVIVRRQSDVDSGTVAVVLIGGREATVKKVIKKGSSLLLVPLNPAYEPLVFTAEETRSLPVTLLGKVVELRAQFQ